MLFFSSLERSAASGSRTMRIIYLICAVICSLLIMESFRALISVDRPGSAFNNFVTVMVRIIQGGLCILGVLMTAIILMAKKPTGPKG